MITYNQICDLYRNEKNTNSICQLPANFEKEVKELITDLNIKGDLQSKKEIENVKNRLKALMEIRLEKIALRAISMQKLQTELEVEEKIFVSIKEMVKKHYQWIEELDKQEKTPTQKLKIIKEVEEYISENGQTKGPYQKDEIVETDLKEAQWLIKGGFAIPST
ncbi:MAG: hypothetical protein ACK4J0_00740 [Candidatus Anstonellaceae archaeon]